MTRRTPRVINPIPLNERENYIELPPRNPVTRDLSAFAKRHRLDGVVLIAFDKETERIGVTSCGEPDAFGKALEKLADRILTMIADGELDPETL